MSDQKPTDKKLANMHYQGIKGDPNEGKSPLPEIAKWRFAKQFEFLGETNGRKLLGSSVLIFEPCPLAVRTTKRLFEVGLGRVGLFGSQQISGAHGLGQSANDSEVDVLKNLATWTKENASWASFEPFRNESIDRKLEDIAKGFEIFILNNKAKNAERILSVAAEFKRPVLMVAYEGREGWIAFASDASEFKNMELPQLAACDNFYFPLLETIAARTVTLILDYFTTAPNKVVTIETFR